MSLIVFTWVAIGLFFSTYNIFLLNNTTPPMLPFIADSLRREMEQSGTQVDLTQSQLEMFVIGFMTVAWVIAWPIMIFQSQDE